MKNSFIKQLFLKLFRPNRSRIVDSKDTLVGKVAVVIGGTSGTGLAIANALSESGAVVVVVSSKGKSEKQYFEQDSKPLNVFKTDITNDVEVKNLFESIKDKYKKIDILVNSAGVFSSSPFLNMESEQVKKNLDINLYGAINTTQSVLKYMLTSKSGTIINIGSKISHNTNIQPNKVIYATAKYGLEGFSFALNKELKGTGIRVCCLMPGTISTFVSKNIRQYLTPTDVADLVLFICKSENIDFEGIVFKSTNQNL